nr:helix-turn-helix transcriptional regulator [Variovorax boronicumulans]
MQVGTVVRRALDASRHLDSDAPPWPEVLDGLGELLGGDSAAYLAFDSAQGLLAFEFRGGDVAARREYAEHYHAHDIMKPPARGAAAGVWLDSAQCYPLTSLQRDVFYADFMCKHRLRQILAFLTEASATRLSAISVQRSRVDQRIGDVLCSGAVRTLTQSVGQALARGRSRAGQALAAVEAALGAFGEAAVLVTRSGALAHAPGPAAQAWFGRNGALVPRNGRLLHRDPALQASWMAALHQAAAGHAPTLALPAGDGAAHRLALAAAPAAFDSGSEALVLVRIAPDRQRKPLQTELLRLAFGLTAAEAGVLASLADGLTPTEHAARQGVAISTVRTQIAVLMAKMDCSRQVDLVRKACALA